MSPFQLPQRGHRRPRVARTVNTPPFSPPAQRNMRMHAIITAVVAAFILGLIADRAITAIQDKLSQNWDEEERLAPERGFARQVQIWNKFVADRHGYIAGDPYRALIETGAI